MITLDRLTFAPKRGDHSVPLGSPPIRGDVSLWRIATRAKESAGCFPLAGIRGAAEIRLEVALRASPAPTAPIRIEAQPHPDLPNVLKSIAPIQIEPGQWSNGSCTVDKTFDVSALAGNGVGAYQLGWNWRLSAGGSLGTSEHFVFVTLGRPTDPWSDSEEPNPALALPWIDVLNRACDWARGATTGARAAELLTRRIFELGAPDGQTARFVYRPDGRNYLPAGIGQPQRFFCEGFLEDAARPRGDQFGLSCVETTAVLTSMANLLGCSLRPMVIDVKKCDTFLVNFFVPLGRPDSGLFREFVTHVVAIQEGEQPDLSDAQVYDPALQIDPDHEPANRGPKFVQPVGVPLGTIGSEPATGVYFPQLVSAKSLGSCVVRKGKPARISPVRQSDVEPCTIFRYLREVSRLQRLRSDRGFALRPPLQALPVSLEIKDWSRTLFLTDMPAVPREGLPVVPPHTRSLFHRRDAPPSSGEVLSTGFWSHPDPAITVSFMAELLATVEVPATELAGLPAITLAVPGGQTLFVLYDGAAARISSIGTVDVDLEAILRDSNTRTLPA